MVTYVYMSYIDMNTYIRDFTVISLLRILIMRICYNDHCWAAYLVTLIFEPHIGGPPETR